LQNPSLEARPARKLDGSKQVMQTISFWCHERSAVQICRSYWVDRWPISFWTALSTVHYGGGYTKFYKASDVSRAAIIRLTFQQMKLW